MTMTGSFAGHSFGSQFWKMTTSTGSLGGHAAGPARKTASSPSWLSAVSASCVKGSATGLTQTTRSGRASGMRACTSSSSAS